MRNRVENAEMPPTFASRASVLGASAMRALIFVVGGLMLGGCMQETLAPTTEASWTARDRQLMAHLPYAQATIPRSTDGTLSTTVARKFPAPLSSIRATSFFTSSCLRAKRSVPESPLAKTRKSGTALPRSAARKNGRRGRQPPASTRGLGPYRPS